MRILIISDAWQPQVNGVVRTYENLLEELLKQGHDVKVIGPDSFVSVPMPLYKEIRLALFPRRKLKRMIEDFNPEFIHVAVEGPLGRAAQRYCLKYDLPYTTSYHTHFPDYVAKRVGFLPKRFRRYIRSLAIAYIRRFHKKSAAMMVATQSLEDDLKAWGFKLPMRRLLRGARLDLFYPGENTEFKDHKGPLYLYVGRVAIEKNIEAFLELDLEGTKVIVGDGPSLNKLKKKYPDVLFMGKRVGEELASIYRSCDLFVFPSKTDTFGIVLIEALASGIPLAAYPVTGPKDIMTEEYLGAMDHDLSKAVEKALKVGTAEQRHNFVKENYSWEKVAEAFIDYQKELG